jgi:hypothetical protein
MLEGEAVVVVTGQGRVKVLNEVAARIWALADGSRSVGDIADTICAEFAVQLDEAQADTTAFLGQLAEQGAVTFMATPNPQVD